VLSEPSHLFASQHLLLVLVSMLQALPHSVRAKEMRVGHNSRTKSEPYHPSKLIRCISLTYIYESSVQLGLSRRGQCGLSSQN
jgi:hypothetical protein